MHRVRLVGSREIPLADAIRRVRAEFLEMPGMQLTSGQAARLWHFEPDFCEAVLTALVEMRFLVKTRDKKFGRA